MVSISRAPGWPGGSLMPAWPGRNAREPWAVLQPAATAGAWWLPWLSPQCRRAEKRCGAPRSDLRRGLISKQPEKVTRITMGHQEF